MPTEQSHQTKRGTTNVFMLFSRVIQLSGNQNPGHPRLECDPTEVNGPTCMLKGDELEAAEDTEASEQATEAPTEEADALTADESTEQNERSMVSTEAEGEKESPVADASSAVEEAQQEATASLEAAQVQEVVGEDLDVAAGSAHEDNVDRIQEGTASAAQEMPDASSRNQEAIEDESEQDSEASSATTGSQEIPKDS
ncbi:protein MGARP isoform 3-T4 [Pangshura tecta]